MANIAEQLKQTSEQALKTITKDSALDVEKFFDQYLIKELHHKAVYGERSFTFPQDLSETAKEHLGSIVESPSVGTYFEFSFEEIIISSLPSPKILIVPSLRISKTPLPETEISNL